MKKTHLCTLVLTVSFIVAAACCRRWGNAEAMTSMIIENP